MFNSVLQAGLTKEQQANGLILIEPDGHTVELQDKSGKRLAVWSSSGATVAEIRKEADRYISGEEFTKFILDSDGKREKLTAHIAKWVDTRVIAEMIIEHLGEQGEQLTFERAKEVWLNTLENLGGGIGLAR